MTHKHEPPTITGFIVTYKNKEQGIVHLANRFSGNALTLHVTPEEMGHLRLHEDYSLKVTPELFHHEPKRYVA